MYILFVSDNFPPESNAPAIRTYEHCKIWAKLGHKVTVLTCFPNFPSGKVFGGYKNRFWKIEIVDGITVIRVWTFMAPNSGIYSRAIDYFSFAVTSVLAGLFLRKPDIIIGTSPQIFAVVSAYVLSMVKRSKLVFEVRDLWPQSFKAVGLKHADIFAAITAVLVQHMYSAADLIVVVTSSFKAELTAIGVKQEKISIFTNGVSKYRTSRIENSKEKRTRFTVGYIGTLGLAHDLFTILRAASLLKANGYENDVSFLFVGSGAMKSELEAYAEKKKLKNVSFVGQVSHNEIEKYWSQLDLAVVHLRKNDEFKHVIPSKLFEAIGFGVPVMHAVPGESAEIVRQHGFGVCINPEQPEQMMNTILDLMNDPFLLAEYRRRAISAAQAFDRGNIASSYAEKLKEVICASK